MRTLRLQQLSGTPGVKAKAVLFPPRECLRERSQRALLERMDGPESFPLSCIRSVMGQLAICSDTEWNEEFSEWKFNLANTI